MARDTVCAAIGETRNTLVLKDCNLRVVSNCGLRRDSHMIVLKTLVQMGIRPRKPATISLNSVGRPPGGLKAALIAAVQVDFCNMKQPYCNLDLTYIIPSGIVTTWYNPVTIRCRRKLPRYGAALVSEGLPC